MNEPQTLQTEDQLSTLQMLFNQQLCEYREIKDLREKLRITEARHQKLADEIQQLLTALSETVAPCDTTAPASSIPSPLGSAGCGFSEVQAIAGFNRETRALLDNLDRAVADADRRRRANPLYDKDWTV